MAFPILVTIYFWSLPALRRERWPMLQVLLALIQYAVVSLFTGLSITLLILAFIRWRKKRGYYAFAGFGFLSALLALAVASFDMFTAESTDRDELVDAFYSNFGFDPPSSVREIKVKNIAVYDAVGHYMAFTYDATVFAKVVAHDQPLQVAVEHSPAFAEIDRDYRKDHNRPDWAVVPEGHTRRIFYKKNFMQHSYSVYYLWVDAESSMVHLHVSYFD